MDKIRWAILGPGIIGDTFAYCLREVPDAEIVEPHEGARFLYVAELDDRAFLAELVQRTCAELPAPRARHKKKQSTMD